MMNREGGEQGKKELERTGLSRRQALTSIGLAGAAAASGFMLSGTWSTAAYAKEKSEGSVQQSVYGGAPGCGVLPLINVKLPPYCAAGDGVTDDSAAVLLALGDLEPGYSLYFPAGTYKLAAWTVTDLLVPIRMYGDGKDATKLVGSGTNVFINNKANIVIEGLSFELWNYPIRTALVSLDYFRMNDVGVYNCNQAVSGSGTDETFITWFTVTNSSFRNISNSVFFMYFGSNRVQLLGNDFYNTVRYVLRMIHVGRDNLQEVEFSKNRVEGHHSGAYSGSSGVARVLQITCGLIRIQDNYFIKVNVRNEFGGTAGTGNANIAYMSCDEQIISGNLIYNCGDQDYDNSGGALFDSKGEAYRSVMIGNIFDNPDQPYAQRGTTFRGENFIFEGNVFTNWTGSCVHSGWGRNQNIQVRNNIFKDNKGTAMGIYGQFKDACISGNIFEHIQGYESGIGFSAIRVTKSSSPTFGKYLIISNNVFQDILSIRDDVPTGTSHAIGIGMYTSTLDSVHVYGNRFENMDHMLIARAPSAGGTLTNLQIWDNELRNVPSLMDFGQITPDIQRFRNNVGIVTSSRGTATVTAGQTFVTVTHGLTAVHQTTLDTPKVIHIVPLSDAGDRFYVSNMTTTTFRINIASAQPGDVSFMWEAKSEIG